MPLVSQTPSKKKNAAITKQLILRMPLKRALYPMFLKTGPLSEPAKEPGGRVTGSTAIETVSNRDATKNSNIYMLGSHISKFEGKEEQVNYS